VAAGLVGGPALQQLAGGVQHARLPAVLQQHRRRAGQQGRPQRLRQLRRAGLGLLAALQRLKCQVHTAGA
jgi:hypothetical protein